MIPDIILRGSISGMEHTLSLRLGHKEKIFVRVGGKVLLFEIYQQDTVLSEKKSAYQRGYKAPISLPEKLLSLLELEIRHL